MQEVFLSAGNSKDNGPWKQFNDVEEDIGRPKYVCSYDSYIPVIPGGNCSSRSQLDDSQQEAANSPKQGTMVTPKSAIASEEL